MDNNAFVNLYIEKLLTKISDSEKKLLLLETQFDFNQKSWEENLKELEEKIKEVEDLNKVIEEQNNTVLGLQSTLAKQADQIEGLNKECVSLSKRKEEDLHVLTLQIEELKRVVLEKDIIIENLKITPETKKISKKV